MLVRLRPGLLRPPPTLGARRPALTALLCAAAAVAAGGCPLLTALSGGEGIACDRDLACPPAMSCVEGACRAQPASDQHGDAAPDDGGLGRDRSTGLDRASGQDRVADASHVDTAVDAAPGDAAGEAGAADSSLSEGGSYDRAPPDTAPRDSAPDDGEPDSAALDRAPADAAQPDSSAPDSAEPDLTAFDAYRPIACTPGQHACLGASLLVCSADQSGWDLVEDCASATLCNARDAQCDPPLCSPDEHRCVGPGGMSYIRLERCNSDRTGWVLVVLCGYGQICDAEGHECDLCVAGEGACQVGSACAAESGYVYMECAADGQSWSVVEDCYCQGLYRCDPEQGCITW